MRISSKDVQDSGNFAFTRWREHYKELLSCYEWSGPDGLQATIAAYGKINAGTADKDVAVVLENADSFECFDDELFKAFRRCYSKAFITLLKRGALDRLLVVQEFTDKDHKQFDAMVAESEDEPKLPAVVVAPVPAKVDLVAVCVNDFRALGSRAFKYKWIDDTRNRPFYDQACAEGRI
jgi:hypothetical protein